MFHRTVRPGQIRLQARLRGYDVSAQSVTFGRLLFLQSIQAVVYRRRSAGKIIDALLEFFDFRGAHSNHTGRRVLRFGGSAGSAPWRAIR